jgi:hypothetical protein
MAKENANSTLRLESIELCCVHSYSVQEALKGSLNCESRIVGLMAKEKANSTFRLESIELCHVLEYSSST